MSRIAQMAEEMKKKMVDEGFQSDKKIAISLRLEPFSIFCIDKFVEETRSSRTRSCQDILSEGVLDGLEALGYTLEELQAQYVAKRSGRDLDAVKADLSKTGFFVEGEKVNV